MRRKLQILTTHKDTSEKQNQSCKKNKQAHFPLVGDIEGLLEAVMEGKQGLEEITEDE